MESAAAATAMVVRDKAAAAGEIVEADADFLRPAVPIELMIQRRNEIVKLTQKLLVRGVDYGTIPGTERKNDDGTPSNKSDTLLKPGAEKLCTFFGLVAEFEPLTEIENWIEGLFYYKYCCKLTRRGRLVATGIGSANSREKKYRRDTRTCPECGKPAIKRGRPRGGEKTWTWYCDRRSSGCGTNFPSDDPAIVDQEAGTDVNAAADLVNTLQKMAQKRAHVAATLYATNASEFFTQDVDDMEIIDAESKDRGAAGGDDVDPRTGELHAKGGKQQPQQPRLRLDDDEVFTDEWVRVAVEKGFCAEAAVMLLGGIFKAAGTALARTDLKGRQELLGKLAAGHYERYREPLNTKAAPVTISSGPSTASGGAAAPAGKVEVTRVVEPAAEAGGGDGMPSAEDLRDWNIFEAAWFGVAHNAGKDEDEARASLAKAVEATDGLSDAKSSTKEWRLRHLLAANDGSFEWSSGKINAVKEAIGAAAR